MVEPQSGAALDLRAVRWSPSGSGDLPSLLEEASQKTGVLLAAPSDWKPAADAPKPGPIADAAPQLFRNAGGVCREVFLLRPRPSRDDDGFGGGGRGGPWIGGASGEPARSSTDCISANAASALSGSSDSPSIFTPRGSRSSRSVA